MKKSKSSSVMKTLTAKIKQGSVKLKAMEKQLAALLTSKPAKKKPAAKKKTAKKADKKTTAKKSSAKKSAKRPGRPAAKKSKKK